MIDPEMLTALWAYARARVGQRDERGQSTTEYAILAAVLAALAIVVGKVIWDKVTAKANSIPTE